MQFELTKALIDDILFSMEDQDGEFALDTYKGMVINTDDDEETNTDNDDAGRFLSLPEWGPADGFRLMERFTAGLRNPVAREELTAALDRGRGVFRAFKDTISRYPEIEKFWFNYKDREMKREIIAWYNALRESWGLEQIGSEPEDIAGLVLEDFRFRGGTAEDRHAAEELHRISRSRYGGGEERHSLAAEIAEGINQGSFPGDICLVAETAGGEFAGYISAVYAAPSFIHIRALEVKPEYQGLGLGETLLARLLEKADSRNIPRISIDLPAGAEHFARILVRESFQPCVQRFCRDKHR
jgi:ribosomal protein S18 acetylase RimI-like enzyme